ncbi:MAG: ROK family protein [Pseudomonadota bacterium]
MNDPRALPSAGAALRLRNLARVLAEIRRRREAARVEIAEALELSPATVTAVIGDLLDEGLIQETTPAAGAGRGRPRVGLRLNPDARRVAGAKISDDRIAAAILDFEGAILGEGAAPLPARRVDLAGLCAALDAALAEALAAAGLDAGEVDALGLGVPGFVDMGTGRVHWSPVLTGAPVDLAPALAARLPFPVFVDNDANLATLAELWFGLGRGARDFLVVTIEHGVGMGIVIDGRVFRGARGLGAEFGHTKIQNEGALCRCGQRGCLEAYVADYALAREAGAALGEFGESAAHGALLARLAEAAEAGDERSRSIYRRAGRMLGLGLANLVNIFDPPQIILSGERMRQHHLIAEELEATLERNRLATGAPAARLTVHRWGDALWAMGGGALALDGLTERIAGG